MPALAPYIPVRNADFVTWLDNFSALITAAPPTYGLVAADAVVIASTTAIIDAQYVLLSSPATKTKQVVADWATDKINAFAVVRPYAQTISLNAGVSSADKVAIGVNPRTSVPLPIPQPITFPVLTIDSTGPSGSILRYRDTLSSPTVKAKPYGVTQIQIFFKPSITPITDPTLLDLNTQTTKSPVLAVAGIGNAGKVIYWAARWINRKGQAGPFGPIINAVAAG